MVPAPPCHREVDRRADGSRLPLPGDVLRSLARLVQATPLVSRAECAECLSATTRRRAPGERLGPRPGVACREARPPPRFTGRTACLLRTRASRSQRPRGEVAAHRADGARTRRRAAVLLRSHESPPLSGVVLRRDHRWSRIRLSPAIAAEVVCGARLEPATGGGCESVAARRGRARCRASPASDQPRPRMMYASRRVCATPRPLRVRLRPTNCDLAGIYARTRLGLRTDRRKHNIQVLSCQLCIGMLVAEQLLPHLKRVREQSTGGFQIAHLVSSRPETVQRPERVWVCIAEDPALCCHHWARSRFSPQL